jgi:hypothetical protein
MSDPHLPRSPSCSNCATPLRGRWCAACGQKVIDDADRRFGHLLAQFAHELFHFDGKLPRTLAALLLHPGRFGVDYLAGRRARYLSPIALFLLINLVYFLAPPLSDFNLSLDEQLHMQPYSALIQPLVEQRLDRRSIDLPEYVAGYASATEHVAKSLIIVHLPMLALVLLLLFPRRPMYYAEHFVIATQLFSLLLALVLLFSALMASAFHLHQWLSAGEFPLRWAQGRWIFGAVLGGLWLVSLRRVYRIGWPRALFVAVASFGGLVLAHFLYRLLQFLLVFALT